MSHESATPYPRADHERALRARNRWLIGGAGVLVTALSVIFATGVIRAYSSHDAWEGIAGSGVLMLATAVIGIQAVYVALTGRLRGPFNRWLQAMLDTVLDARVP